MASLSPDSLLGLLLWILGALSIQFFLVLAAGAGLQLRRNRLNQLRIQCALRWEDGLVAYLYGDGPGDAFQGLGPEERRLFIPFLLKSMGTLQGTEGEAIRALYGKLDLACNLDRRLGSRQPNERALAALEVGSFFVEAHYPRLLALLKDPVPRVAHAAARSLAGTGRLDFAGPVLAWVLEEDEFQQERLLWILQGFGPPFLHWLGDQLAENATSQPRKCMIFALLAASMRNLEDTSRLEAMLEHEDPEVQTAALKALGSLGNPEALPVVLPFARHESWVLRAQAAKAIGALAGASGLPVLLELLADPVFAVRRNAAHALSQNGPAGREALRWVAGDTLADRFARDLALERLQWAHPDHLPDPLSALPAPVRP